MNIILYYMDLASQQHQSTSGHIPTSSLTPEGPNPITSASVNEDMDRDDHSSSSSRAPSPCSTSSSTSDPDEVPAPVSAIDRHLARAQAAQRTAYEMYAPYGNFTYLYGALADGVVGSTVETGSPSNARTHFYALEIISEFSDGAIEFSPIEVAYTEIDKMFDFGRYLYLEGEAFGPVRDFAISYCAEDGGPLGVATDGRSRVHARMKAIAEDHDAVITTNVISYPILDPRPAERGVEIIFHHWIEFCARDRPSDRSALTFGAMLLNAMHYVDSLVGEE